MLISKSKLLSISKGLFRSIGLEVSFSRSAATEPSILRSVLQEHAIQFIVDVGANSGQYGVLVRKCGFDGPIVSFEPLPAAHEQLLAIAAADAQWTVADKVALGARTAIATINVASNSVSSSLLDMNARHVDAAPASVFMGTEQVRVVPLDECIERYIGSRKGGLLKIDTQGYEMEVLKGAHRSLTDRIDIVQTELSLVELYSGQPLMLDVCNFLKECGFDLRHIIPGLKDPNGGMLLQIDGIFFKH